VGELWRACYTEERVCGEEERGGWGIRSFVRSVASLLVVIFLLFGVRVRACLM
jgi:hypothetical protein